MKPLLCVLIILALSFGATGNDPHPAEAKKTETELFSGIWEIVAVQPPGSTKEAKRLVFRKDHSYAAVDADGKELWAGTFDLDPAATPKVWDHRTNESQKKGGDALGIYELDGDKLKACCVVGTWKDKHWTGKPRPTEFKLPAADVVLELRRVKTGK